MPELPKQRSTEYYGLGQSGYTAGRVEGDPSLELQIEDRNMLYPRHVDERAIDLDDDDRFTGRGGHHPSADDTTPSKP